MPKILCFLMPGFWVHPTEVIWFTGEVRITFLAFFPFLFDGWNNFKPIKLWMTIKYINTFVTSIKRWIIDDPPFRNQLPHFETWLHSNQFLPSVFCCEDDVSLWREQPPLPLGHCAKNHDCRLFLRNDTVKKNNESIHVTRRLYFFSFKRLFVIAPMERLFESSESSIQS